MIMEACGTEKEGALLLIGEKDLGRYQVQVVMFSLVQTQFPSKQSRLCKEEENLHLEVEIELTGLDHENVFYHLML